MRREDAAAEDDIAFLIEIDFITGRFGLRPVRLLCSSD